MCFPHRALAAYAGPLMHDPNTTKNHRLVRRCCYGGMFIQAMMVNLTPLFFIPLRAQFGLSFEQLGRLVLINFITQMIVDLVCTVVVDRFGLIKPLTVAAQVLTAVGLWLFAGAPLLFSGAPYHGLVLGTVTFSLGCGLLEVLISPIINAVPSEQKEGDMAFLHAFYPIGKVTVIVITAAALWFFGHRAWGWIAIAWSIVPLINTAGFLAVELPSFVHESEREKTRVMARTSLFWLALVGILLAGATEVTLAQWTSAYAQAALGLSPMVANGLGFGLFAVMMVVGRLWFALRGPDRPLRPLVLRGALFSGICYALIALSPWPAVSLAACVLSGLFVSMLWPGIVSISAKAYPKAGISLFALLAAFGDAGAGGMPWGVGYVADAVTGHIQRAGGELPAWVPLEISPASAGLRAGILVAMICPFLLVAVMASMKPRK